MEGVTTVLCVDAVKMLRVEDACSEDWKGLKVLDTIGATVMEKGSSKLRVSI